jgi:hypothetical protein
MSSQGGVPNLTAPQFSDIMKKLVKESGDKVIDDITANIYDKLDRAGYCKFMQLHERLIILETTQNRNSTNGDRRMHEIPETLEHWTNQWSGPAATAEVPARDDWEYVHVEGEGEMTEEAVRHTGAASALRMPTATTTNVIATAGDTILQVDWNEDWSNNRIFSWDRDRRGHHCLFLIDCD